MTLLRWVSLLLAGASCRAQIAIKNSSNPQPLNFQLGASSRCCHLTDEEDSFQQCIRDAVNEVRAEKLVELNTPGGPKLGVALITHMGDGAMPSSLSLGIKQGYAETNGYFIDIFEPARKFSWDWEKIDYMRKSMDDVNGWARNVDYIGWLGDTVIVVDMGMRIEKIFSKYKKAHMIISEGIHDAKIATSFILLRNNARTVEFLEDWLRQGRGLEMSFQDAETYAKLIDGNEADYEGFVKILPADALNTIVPAARNFKPHNQVLNINEEHDMFVQRVFSEAFHEICRVDESKKTSASEIRVLPLQLDLNAQNLSTWGLSVYRALFDADMKVYAVGSVSGSNNASLTGTLAFNLRNMARLLETSGHETEAQTLRESVFKEMFLNFKKRRHINSEQKQTTGQMLPDWLEFMDHISLVGSEYAQKIVDVDERRVAMKVMLELANELDMMDTTRYNVQQRLMNIHMDMGMISSKSNDNEDSLKHFVEAVRLGRVLLSNKYITEAEMFFPLSFCGDAFMRLTRYKEAIVMYSYALDIGGKHLAAGDSMYPTMKLQYGIACYYDQRYRTAVSSIEEGLEYFAKLDEDLDDETFEVIESAINVLDAAKKAKYDPKVFDENLRNEF